MDSGSKLASLARILAVFLGLGALSGVASTFVGFGDGSEFTDLMAFWSAFMPVLSSWLLVASVVLYFLLARYSDGTTRGLFSAAAAAGVLLILRTIGIEAAGLASVQIYDMKYLVFGSARLLHAVMGVAVVWGLFSLVADSSRRSLSLGLASLVTLGQLVAVVTTFISFSQEAGSEQILPSIVSDLLYAVTYVPPVVLAWIAAEVLSKKSESRAPIAWTGAALLLLGFVGQFATGLLHALRAAAEQQVGFGGSAETATAAGGVVGALGGAVLFVAIWLLMKHPDERSTGSFRTAFIALGVAALFNLIGSAMLFSFLTEYFAPLATGVGSLAGVVAMFAILGGFQRLGEVYDDAPLADRARLAKTSIIIVLVGTVVTAGVFSAAPRSAWLALLPALVVLGASLFFVGGLFGTIGRAMGVLQDAPPESESW